MEFVWDTGKRFWQSSFYVRFITDTLSRNSSPDESKCHRCNPSAGKYRETCRGRWRTIWEHNTNADVCRKAVNHEFFLTSGNSTEPFLIFFSFFMFRFFWFFNMLSFRFLFDVICSFFPFFWLAFHFIVFLFFTLGHVKGSARDGWSRHPPTNQTKFSSL